MISPVCVLYGFLVSIDVPSSRWQVGVEMIESVFVMVRASSDAVLCLGVC